MPTIQSTPAVDDYVLAEDFLSLDHWQTYGASTAEHRLAPEMSLGYGGSLYVPGDGSTRIARPTDLVPGETYQLTLRAHPTTNNGTAPRVQVSNGRVVNGASNFIVWDLSGLSQGWNHVLAQVTIPPDWDEVWLRIMRTDQLGGPGFLHRIRGHRVTPEGEDQ